MSGNSDFQFFANFHAIFHHGQFQATIVGSLNTELRRDVHNRSSPDITNWTPKSLWLQTTSTCWSHCHLKLNISKDKNLSTNFLFQVTLSMVSGSNISQVLGFPKDASTKIIYIASLQPLIPLSSRLVRIMKNCSTQFLLFQGWQTLAH